MQRLIYLHLILSFILTVAACAPELEPQESCNFVMNSQSRRVSWGGGPISVGIDQNFPSEYIPALKEAMSVWEGAIGKLLFHEKFVVINRADAAAVNIFLLWDENWAGKFNEQAKTTVSMRGDYISSAFIAFNAGKSFSLDTEPGKIHMPTLMGHELGHALGLDHIDHKDYPKAIMQTTLPENTSRMELAAIDKESLACEY